jgi:hypothetical protein
MDNKYEYKRITYFWMSFIRNFYFSHKKKEGCLKNILIVHDPLVNPEMCDNPDIPLFFLNLTGT